MSQSSGYDVKWSCENVPPPASYSTQSDSYIRWLPNWRTNSNVLRSGSANMTNNQLHNLSCDMSYHLLDVCLHLEKWKGDCGVHQQGSGRDTRRCRALNSGESSFLYIKHSTHRQLSAAHVPAEGKHFFEWNRYLETVQWTLEKENLCFINRYCFEVQETGKYICNYVR